MIPHAYFKMTVSGLIRLRISQSSSEGMGQHFHSWPQWSPGQKKRKEKSLVVSCHKMYNIQIDK